jgi:hypothetical protein
MWTFGGAQKSGQKEDSILKMENRFGSIEIRKLKNNLYEFIPKSMGFSQ